MLAHAAAKPLIYCARRKGLQFGLRYKEPKSQMNTPGPGSYVCNPQRPVTSDMLRAPVACLSSSWKRYGLNTPPGARSHIANEETSRAALGEFVADSEPRIGNPRSINSTKRSAPQAKIGTARSRIAICPSRKTDLVSNASSTDVHLGDGPAKYNLFSTAGDELYI